MCKVFKFTGSQSDKSHNVLDESNICDRATWLLFDSARHSNVSMFSRDNAVNITHRNLLQCSTCKITTRETGCVCGSIMASNQNIYLPSRVKVLMAPTTGALSRRKRHHTPLGQAARFLHCVEGRPGYQTQPQPCGSILGECLVIPPLKLDNTASNPAR